MARRIRSIKPEFFESEDVAALPRDVRLSLIGLWKHVDDHGKAPANPALFKAGVWPLDDDITLDVIESHYLILATAGFIELYAVHGREYLQVVEWTWWQRVDRATESRIPDKPNSSREPLANPREPLVGEGRGESGRGRESGQGESPRERARAGEPREGPTFQPTSALPPSPFCRSHPAGTDNPCRNCGTARRRHDMWLAEQFTDEGDPDDDY